MLRFAVLAVCVGLAVSHSKYMDDIPNGHNVKNPCNPNEQWGALGHNDADDGHSGENAFGKDFHHHHKEWSTTLCKMDSDRDGKTNGEELGDPSCIWSKHGNHNLPKPTGHPGICEPVGSPACAYQGFSCATGFSGGKHHHH